MLETKVDTVIESLKGVTTRLDMLLPTLVTQSQLAEKTAPLHNEITALKIELVNAKKRSTLQTWLTGTLSAAFGVFMTVLIQGYFSK